MIIKKVTIDNFSDTTTDSNINSDIDSDINENKEIEL
jgi:hypothetical protein